MKAIKMMLPWFLLAAGVALVSAQDGKVMTAEELFKRNVGTKEQQMRQFPPYQVIGNIYYVGSEALSSYLIVTREGNILINSMYEANVPGIRASVEQLGFKFTDIKILLGSHAHGDHMEGDALVKEWTGARVMAMAEDVPALERMRPGNKPHPIDRVLHDGEEVSLGGATLVAHLTPGHTKGNTTWTTKATEDGKTYNVVIIGSMGVNPGYNLVDTKNGLPLAESYLKTFQVMRSLPCDVPLASHPAMYNMAAKYARIGKGPNPFIDPEGYKKEVEISELAFKMKWDDQKAAPPK
jgi:metallo-beta-lactamase class B